MFPAHQQQSQFGDAHYFTQMHLASPVAASYALSASSFVPEELRCQYSSKRCENTRTNKKSGGLHKFCAVHREKANRNQMRLDHRRRVLKRMAQREQQRTRSAPSSVSGNSSPYQKRVKDENNDNDEHNDHIHRRHSSLIKVEDDLEIDLMPLALHSDNASQTSALKPLFDPQDLHILETLLFSDEDQAEDDEDMGDANASPVCRGECCGHSSPASSTTRSTRTASSPAAVSSWSLNL